LGRRLSVRHGYFDLPQQVHNLFCIMLLASCHLPLLLLMGPAITDPNGALVFRQNQPLRGLEDLSMKKKFSVEQIVAVLKQAEVGVPIAELIRKVGISEQTFYRWKSKYVGLEVDQVRQLKQLRDENTRLKQLVAELTLDKTMLQDVLRKKL
jgi:putative transposase